MARIVEKLQVDALDPNIAVSDLLRRVKLTATKLRLGEVEDWVGQELNGYQTTVPDYRMVRGEPVGFNPVHGEFPIGSGLADVLSQFPNRDPVSALENLVGEHMYMRYPDEISKRLDEAHGVKGWVWRLMVSPSEPKRILDQVRTLVLDWALALERTGIMGTEINFDEKDRERARSAGVTINVGSIGQFAGNLGQGNVSGDASITTQVNRLRDVFEQIAPHTQELITAGADKNLSERLAALEKAITQGRKEPAAVRGLLVDLRNSLSGAVGNLLATGAISAINALLGAG